MFNEKKKALEISSEIEHLIATNNAKAPDIAKHIGISSTAFSYNRCALRKGRLVSSRFIFGIYDFFLKNKDY